MKSNHFYRIVWTEVLKGYQESRDFEPMYFGEAESVYRRLQELVKSGRMENIQFSKHVRSEDNSEEKIISILGVDYGKNSDYLR